MQNRTPAGVARRALGGAFTLIELLVVVALVAILLAVLLPALSAARREGMSAACGARLRELGSALHMYANDYDGRAMPLAYWMAETIGSGPVVYWWGTNAGTPEGVDHMRGFVWPYLQSALQAGSVFECPEQPWGSYLPQGAASGITSTYGYNGYYLSPAHTPGWGMQIAQRPWQSLSRVRDAARVFAFADTAIDFGGPQPMNNALLDPPMLYSGTDWSPNFSPTTSFRHRGSADAVHVDGHVARYKAQRNWLKSPRFSIGSIGTGNGPHYVPDWREWNGE